MKILFVLTPAFNPNDGGVQRTTYKLGKYFTEQGLEVFYYSLKHNGHISDFFGTLHHAPHTGGCYVGENIDHLKISLSQIKPDVVINQMPYEIPLRRALYEHKQMVGYILLGCLRNSLFSFKSNANDILRHRLPQWAFLLVNNFVGMRVVQWNHKRKHAAELRAIIDQHDRFILLTPNNKKELDFFVGRYKEEKILAIPNSIPEVQAELGQRKKVLLHVGRLNIPQKRSDLLLPVWELLYDKLPDWEFVIVGDGPFKKDMQKRIQEKRIPRVSMVGYQKPEPFYQTSSVFLMPSAYEGFPNVLIEAQSFGLAPVLLDSYASVSWIVNHNTDAFLCKPFNVREMADKVLELGLNQSLLRNMQQAALHNATRFTIDVVGKLWIELFETLPINKKKSTAN